jgi:hypothetical protein
MRRGAYGAEATNSRFEEHQGHIWWSAMPIKALSPNGTSVQRVLREGGVTY